jgi:integrase/recombinase XerD
MDLHEFEAWLAESGKSKNTIIAYLSRVKIFLTTVPCEPMEIDAEWVEAYLQAHSHLKAQTLGQTIEAVRAYARYLGLEVEIPNPYRGQVEYNGRVMPSKVDMRKIWRAANELEPFYRQREKAIIAVLYYAGVRIDEARCINVEDLDFVNHELHITNGKGGKARSVYMNRPLMLALLEYLDQRRQIKTDTARLFVSYGRNHRCNELVYGSFRSVIRGLVIDAGLPHLNPYCFRHAFATNLLKQGLAPEAIAELMGHASSVRGPLAFYIVPASLSAAEALEALQIDVDGEAA